MIFTFYAPPAVYMDYETPHGIIIVAGLLCRAFSSGVLLEKSSSSDFWLARSPGWIYGLTAFALVAASPVALLLPYRADANFGALTGAFVTGLLLMLAG